MAKKTIGFRYGVLCDTLEKQANEQGFTLGKKADELESYRKAVTTLHFGLDLPDSFHNKLLQKIQKQVVKALKKKDS